MKFLKFDVFTSFSSNIYRKSCLLPQRLWPLTSQTAPPLSGSGKPPYGAKHLAVAPTLLTTSRVELISWSELRRRRWMRPAARAASTSEVISGHATGMNTNTQKKNKKGTKKRRKTSEGRHGGYQRISLVCTLVSSELLLAAESSHEHTGLYGGGGRGGRRGRSSWPRPLPVQRPLADPGLPTCLTTSSSSPPFTPLSSCSRLLFPPPPSFLQLCFAVPSLPVPFPFLLKSTTAANNNFIYASFLWQTWKYWTGMFIKATKLQKQYK